MYHAHVLVSSKNGRLLFGAFPSSPAHHEGTSSRRIRKNVKNDRNRYQIDDDHGRINRTADGNRGRLSGQADLHGERGVDLAGVGVLVLVWLEVGVGTGLVTSLAYSGLAVAAIFVGLDGEAVLGELRRGAHVNAGQIPPDLLGALGVLELQDIRHVRLGGHLDGDTTAVELLPGARPGAAIGVEGLHVADMTANSPQVDRAVQIVDDLDASIVGAVALASNVREGRRESGEGGRETESLSEHHCGGLFERGQV